MSFAELKQAVNVLSNDERLELADYLRRLFKENDPQWQSEIARRLDVCLEGRGHTSSELLALHDRLNPDRR